MSEAPETHLDRVNARTWNFPDTYLILVGVALFAFLLTYLVPEGQFQLVEVEQANGEISKTIDPDSFQFTDKASSGLPLFASGGNMGLLNIPFEGLVSGTKYGASIGVFAFILIAGGAFGIIMATGAIHKGLLRLIAKSQHSEKFAIPILFLAFSLGGAVFGMGEEAIPFVLIVVPVFIAMGYDSITGVLVTYVATQIGFACSWMNPFSVSIAQSIAELPLLSGTPFRLGLWCLFTTVALVFTWRYALSVKHNPQRSLAYASDNSFRSEEENRIDSEALNIGDYLILGILVAGVGWIIWGVTTQGYYLPEIATQFFTMGLLAGIVGCIFKLNEMHANAAVAAFKNGCAQLLPAALIVAFAKGIVLVLGGSGAENPSVLNTLLYYASLGLSELNSAFAAVAMFFFQSIFNFFVTSGSGQAALTMPLMAPLADLVGVSRQTAVLAFQLGDGFTNIVVPTSASLMGCLGAARLDWSIWLRFISYPLAMLFGLSIATMIVAVSIGF